MIKKLLIATIYLAVASATVLMAEDNEETNMIVLRWPDGEIEHSHDDVRHIHIDGDNIIFRGHSGEDLSSAELTAGMKILCLRGKASTGLQDVKHNVSHTEVRIEGRVAWIQRSPADETSACSIYTFQGHKVLGCVVPEGLTKASIDLGDLMPGFYVLSVDSRSIKFRLD